MSSIVQKPLYPLGGLTRRSVLALTAAAAASQISPFNARAAAAVKLGYLNINAMTSVYVPAANPWSDKTLDIQFSKFQGGPTIIQAIQSGGLHAGELAASVAISLASRGIPIVCLLTCNHATSTRPYNRMMVAKDSKIRSLGDLDGKTIGVLALGTLDHVEVLTLLKKADIDPRRVKIVPVPVPNQAQALAAGQVDAMMMPPPADSVAEMQFGARMLADATEGLPYYPVEVLVVDAAWAEANTETVRALVSGWLTVGRWIESNQAKARQAARTTLGISAELSDVMHLPRWCLNGLPVMPGMWNLYNTMVANKLVDPSPDPAAMMKRYFIDPAMKYVIPALQEIGRVDDKETDSLKSIPLPYLTEDLRNYSAPWEV